MIRYIISIAIFVAVAHSVKVYRSDYEYNRKTDAFYKLHTDSAWHDIARDTCKAENAKLMVAMPRDVVQAHGMLKAFPDIGEYIWGADDGLDHEYEEIEETELESFLYEYHHHEEKCEVITRSGEVYKTGCHHMYPFICKVEAKDVVHNARCNVSSAGYQYVENVGSCYKISNSTVSWNQAFAECRAEGAHLLVLNSDLERQAVHKLTKSVPASGLPWFYAGIRAEKTKDGSPLIFKTITGQTLEEAGYAEWCPGEPNNWAGDEVCGSITRSDGKYNDIACYHYVAFICEKEVNVNKESVNIA